MLMSLFLLILGVVLFIGLVVVHEWGHFIMARRNGVKVEEFGIFFPPRLYSHKTKGGWLFTINLLPLGGFVKLKGEHDSDTAKGSFGAASLAAKSKIMAAGVVMNFVVAIVLLMIVALIGMPQLVPNQFTVKSDTKVVRSEVITTYVDPGSPASRAGLKSTDVISSISAPGQKTALIGTPDQLKVATKHFAGQKVAVNYSRGGVQHTGTTTLLSNKVVEASQKTDNPKGQLGVVPAPYSLQRSTWSAPVVAIGLTGQFAVLTFQGVGHALAGLGSIIAGSITGNTGARQHGQAAASAVSGPVGTYAILQLGSLLGYQFILMLIAIISLSLAVMNILPIPALDGGRLWLTLITRGIRKPLTAKLEERVNATGFALLLVLIIAITVVDVRRFF
jgi:regulator of sigma E protease